jgi:hypothetical protein
LSGTSDEAACAGVRIDEVIIQHRESTHVAKIIVNIAPYTTNNRIQHRANRERERLRTPTDRQELIYIGKSTTIKPNYNRTLQLRPKREPYSPIAVWLVSNMHMCVDDQCTDLEALGVGTNEFFDFFAALEHDERWHLRK